MYKLCPFGAHRAHNYYRSYFLNITKFKIFITMKKKVFKVVTLPCAVAVALVGGNRDVHITCDVSYCAKGCKTSTRLPACTFDYNASRYMYTRFQSYN